MKVEQIGLKNENGSILGTTNVMVIKGLKVRQNTLHSPELTLLLHVRSLWWPEPFFFMMMTWKC